jgi:hypothetical protein
MGLIWFYLTLAFGLIFLTGTSYGAVLEKHPGETIAAYMAFVYAVELLCPNHQEPHQNLLLRASFPCE